MLSSDQPLHLSVVFSNQARVQAQRLDSASLRRLEGAFQSLANLIACCPSAELDLPPAVTTLKTKIDGLAVAYRVHREQQRLELVDVLLEAVAEGSAEEAA